MLLVVASVPTLPRSTNDSACQSGITGVSVGDRTDQRPAKRTAGALAAGISDGLAGSYPLCFAAQVQQAA